MFRLGVNSKIWVSMLFKILLRKPLFIMDASRFSNAQNIFLFSFLLSFCILIISVCCLQKYLFKKLTCHMVWFHRNVQNYLWRMFHEQHILAERWFLGNLMTTIRPISKLGSLLEVNNRWRFWTRRNACKIKKII